MFYPILSTLEQHQVDRLVISQLDSWLGTRRKAVWHALNPLQFSIDSGIDEELALYVFALCTEAEFGLLRVKYVLECPVCDRNIKTYYSASDIPQFFTCLECGTHIEKIDEEWISIWFELLKPTTELITNEQHTWINGVTGLGKTLAFAQR
jgi:hypothetical protein